MIHPPWMNRDIKNVISALNDFHKKIVVLCSNMDNLFMFKNLQNQLIESIRTAKQKYFNKISKNLLTTTQMGKKVLCIDLNFHKKNMSLTLKEKSESFNSFFTNQCSLILNTTLLPSELKLPTEHTLTSCGFSETDILQIVNSQDSNKAHGHDMISIHMLKLCGEEICRPLNIIFKLCLNTDKFPLEWRKGNVSSVKWSVLAHLESQSRGQNFQAQI